MRAFVTDVKSSKYNLSKTAVYMSRAGWLCRGEFYLGNYYDSGITLSRYRSEFQLTGLAGLSCNHEVDFDCVKFTCHGLGKVIRSLKYSLAINASLEVRQCYARRFAVSRTKKLAWCSNNSKQCSNNVAKLCCAMKIVVTNRSMQRHVNIFKLKFSFCFIDIFS